MFSSLRTRVKNTHISRVEITFLLLLLLFGIPMIVLVPPGAGYDEEDHLVRVWELSAFSLIPGGLSPQEMKYPTLFRDFAYRQQGSTGILEADFWQKYARASLYERGFIRRELDTKSIYSPALLFPQAITMRLLGRNADLPALPVFYVCRLAGLLSYLILVWLAIRWIPFGKWILLVLAISPIALFQAATVSPDAISNGIGFLFIAGCLRMAGVTEIGWKEAGTITLLVFLLFLAKLNLLPLILLPFFLIPLSRFPKKEIYGFLWASTVILFLVEVVGWNVIATTHIEPVLANEANPAAQLLHMAGHPLVFLQTVSKDLLTNGWVYFQGWINGYGYYYWTPPQIVSFFFLLSLGSVLFMESTLAAEDGGESRKISRKFRIVFLLVFAASYLATVVSLYASFTPVGSDQVFGVQGRYFIPLVLPLFLVLSSLSWTRKNLIASPKWTIILLMATLSLNVLGVLLSFHVPCGTTFYQIGLCYRPLFRDFPSEVRTSQPISNEISLTQEIQAACNGLAELRLMLLPSAPGDQGTTRFILQDTTNGQSLLDRSVPNDQITTEDWYSLRFDPDWQSAGKQYVLKIPGTNTSTTQGLRVLYTTQSEFNLGDLYENEHPLQEDLVLQYGCMSGLRKIWLTGKP